MGLIEEQTWFAAYNYPHIRQINIWVRWRRTLSFCFDGRNIFASKIAADGKSKNTFPWAYRGWEETSSNGVKWTSSSQNCSNSSIRTTLKSLGYIDRIVQKMQNGECNSGVSCQFQHNGFSVEQRRCLICKSFEYKSKECKCPGGGANPQTDKQWDKY